MTRLGEHLLEVDDPPVQGAGRLRRQPDGLEPGPAAACARPDARGPVHRGDGAVPDRHRRLRRHRAARDDADRAPRRARRLRAHVPAPGTSPRSQPPGECLSDHRDVPPPGARAWA